MRSAAACLVVLGVFFAAPVPVRGDGAAVKRFLLGAFTAAAVPAPEPWVTDRDATNEARFALALAYTLYRRAWSSQDGDVCSFTPSCSRYAKMAVAKYGILRGIVMAADRLQRCNGLSGNYYPRDPSTGRLYDPVP
jgi:uncharacterized protein